MPTRRVFVTLLLAFLLYLFANQTQVGWLYVMSALFTGMPLAAFWFHRKRLAGISPHREISGSELFEGDELTLRLVIENQGNRPVWQVRSKERCPLAAPDSAQASMPIFIPFLAPGARASLAYSVDVYKRGVHTFPPLEWATGAPFGFFASRRVIHLHTSLLVYPELRPLRRFELLDRRPSIQQTRAKAGLGTEVLGIRPYRSGDSPRHIHWRSVAKTRQLISKEFADETQPGVSLALDLFPNPYPDPTTKHNPFEWAVKIVASIGEYALRYTYPLHLLVDQTGLAAPRGPLNRLVLLEYLAHVQPTSLRTLDQILASDLVETFLAVVMPWPNLKVIAPLAALQRSGIEILVVLVDPASFPDGGNSARELDAALAAAGIRTRLVAFGDDWTAILEPKTQSWLQPTAAAPIPEGEI